MDKNGRTHTGKQDYIRGGQLIKQENNRCIILRLERRFKGIKRIL